jgi:hypothetical protein
MTNLPAKMDIALAEELEGLLPYGCLAYWCMPLWSHQPLLQACTRLLYGHPLVSAFNWINVFECIV